jgi:dTMP kinase
LSGRLFVIEGLDGSGKATQAQRLCNILESQGRKVRKISFPNYESNASALVKMYLNGEFGKDPDSVNAYAASTFFAVDRFASFKTDWSDFYHNGGIIIADRYTTSNAVHQCSKLPKAQWEAYLRWLFDFEYRLMGIPAPDSVVYLQVDPMVSQQLMHARYQGDDSKKDIHERNTGYLNRSQEAAQYCAESLGWKTVHCVRDGKMRDIDDIGQEVLSLLDL